MSVYITIFYLIRTFYDTKAHTPVHRASALLLCYIDGPPTNEHINATMHSFEDYLDDRVGDNRATAKYDY